MIKYNYIRLLKSKKIRYLKNNQKNETFIVFLHGFMSDLNGKKPKTFLKFAKKKKLGFLALEYSGHGKSSGKFIEGNVTKWTKETTILIKKIVKKNQFILIGSSMGAWISLNQFKIFKKQIKGFLGIGAAPEFLENLMWKKFTKKMKQEIYSKGIINLRHGNYEYPITYQLIKDGRNNKILNKSIHHELKVTMIHGEKDESVPSVYSKKVLRLFKNAFKKLVIVKNGDHSLSSNKYLKILIKELNILLS
ncbi:alpha/beta fold hydrolase [Candidatus Pelagibacter communis]|uniref:alpha/beta fold hydrolase n=1 Tax=Pelagibacter ubique TaxID=198252 RepID=UPI00094C8228|nr:alpha/beta hydrolase [Candidatus Pelagibacter ubique]|tara:strand:- start:1568 stop:2314 length:747 start_codon:yes stop_codon:yes gene_type:complete